MQFSYAAAISGLTKICRGGVDDTVPSTPVEPGTNEDELLPLELNFGTSAMTKALVEDTVLPTGSSVGITVRDDYGRYTGDDYTNIRYSSALSAGVQVWETTSPVLLARETGTLFSYWPHSEDEVDGKTITVAATSDVQTDYMWGLPVAVSKSNRTASITMQHALSAVRIYCKRGSYTGAGEITGVAFGGDCAATAGTLDLTCGALDDLSGQGTMIAPAITSKTITSSYQKVSDIIVVPTSGTNGKVVVTLDGSDYPIEFSTLDLNPGEMSEFYLTANDGELSATDITVGDWTYGDPEGSEINITDQVKITGNIEDVLLSTKVENGVVTIVAAPRVKVNYKEVEVVDMTGDADISQSAEDFTGIRTIVISNIKSDITICFNGTYIYDMIITGSIGNEDEFSFISNKVTFARARYKDSEDYFSFDKRLYFKNVQEAYPNVKLALSNPSLCDYKPPQEYYYNQPDKLYQVCIGDRVEEISDNAFYVNGYPVCSVKKITLPQGLKSIGMNAFRTCTRLESINLPDELETISEYAFYECSSLYSITIPKNVKNIKQDAFLNTGIKVIKSMAKEAPTLNSGFGSDYGVLVVPVGSDYSAWMNDFLGEKNWTLVYMNE